MRKQRDHNPDPDQLIWSLRSEYLVDDGWGSFVWLTYILPSALVNKFLILTAIVLLIIVVSLVMSVVRVILSAKSLLVHSFCLCRVLMLRRKAAPTETELRVEHSNMVNEALEMADMEWNPEMTSESTIPSFQTLH